MDRKLIAVLFLFLLSLSFAQLATTDYTKEKLGDYSFNIRDKEGAILIERTLTNVIDKRTNTLLDCGGEVSICEYKINLTGKEGFTLSMKDIEGRYMGEGAVTSKVYHTEIKDTITYSDCDNKSGNCSIKTITHHFYEPYESTDDITFKHDEQKEVVILFTRSKPYKEIDIYDRMLGIDFPEAALWTNATGGTLSNFTNATGTFTVHTFTSNGTFTVPATGTNGTVAVLVIGGGGGAGGEGGGGGGAGGFIYNSSFAVSQGTYTVTIGAGGTGGSPGINGSNSVFGNSTFNHTAIGGGHGSHNFAGDSGNGGSGGGAAQGGTAGLGTVGQGNDGGRRTYGSSGGGGGGAGAVGSAGPGGVESGGDGGAGLQINIDGTTVTYSCGGGGGGWAILGGAGGCSSAGSGAPVTATAGQANRGGGGGGGSQGQAGAAGGTGIVVVVYQTTGAPLTSSITINSPLNTTYVSSSVILNYTANDSSLATVNCSYKVDGGAWSSPTSVIANSTYQTTISGLTDSGHLINVTCNGSVVGVNNSVSFGLIYTNITSIGYTSTVNETESHTFNITVQKDSTITSTEANLTYNGTLHTASLILENASQFVYSSTFNIPLVEVNDTNRTLNWTYGYTNGVTYIATSNNSNQTILWAYFPTSIYPDASILAEGASYLLTGITTNRSEATLTTTAYVNTTAKALSFSSGAWTITTNAPLINGTSVYNISLNLSMSLNITYAGTSYLRNLTNSTNLTIVNYFLTSCGGVTNTTSINYSIIDAATLLPVTTTYSNIFTSSVDTETQTGSATNYSWCIYPSNATINIATTESYTASGYGYLAASRSISANGSQQNITVTLLNSSTAKLTQLKVLQAPALQLPGAVISVETYTPPGTYAYLSSCTTDATGSCNIILTPNTQQYRYNVTYNGAMTSFGPEVLSCSPSASLCYRTFVLGSQATVSYFTQPKGVCHYVNTTLTLTCTSNDTSATIVNGYLDVWKILPNGTSNLTCSQTYAGAVGTLLCVMPPVQGDYYYLFYGNSTSETFYFDSGYITDLRSISQPFGLDGLIIAALFIICVAAIGYYNITVSIMLVDVALIAVQLMGITQIGWEIIVGFVLISGMLIYKLRM